MNELTRFGVSVSTELINHFDKSITDRGYKTRSEAIRDMMRDYLVALEWQNKSQFVVGTVTIVYDHETRELPNILTALEHRYHHDIVCTTHVHLDDHNCLEVIVVKGDSAHVQTIADQLISLKGIKHGKLVCTTGGKEIH